jgi:phosphoribosylformimino-5-aminoimidazole carboxamide ribotide isomerase
MEVIPVIDLLGGRVVRGVAGRRDTYRPILSEIACDADPGTIAGAFVQRFGFPTAYVADLDAITQCRPDPDAWRKIASAGLELLLDAGISSPTAAQQTHVLLKEADIRAELVIGLESLASAEDLIAIQDACAGRALIFSLDLHAGRPLTRLAAWKQLSPLDIARQVESAGIQKLIVLDLADVGVSNGPRTLELCRQIREQTDFATLIAGGGVRGVADLRALASAGASAALVASALHDLHLNREDVVALKQFAPPT